MYVCICVCVCTWFFKQAFQSHQTRPHTLQPLEAIPLPLAHTCRGLHAPALPLLHLASSTQPLPTHFLCSTRL